MTPTDTDLAFRFRHGWIRINPDGKDADTTAGETDATRLAKNVGNKIGSQSEWDAAAKVVRQAREAREKKTREALKNQPGPSAEDKAREAYYRMAKKHGKESKKAQAARMKWYAEINKTGTPKTQAEADFYGAGGFRLSTPVKGDEIDLDWAAYNSRRKKGVQAPRKAPGFKPKPKPASFQKAPGTESTPYDKAAIAKRAAKPGHFRAKAILAAQSGNVAAAKKFEAKRMAAKAARVKVAATKPKPASFSQPAKPPPVPKPKKPKGPRKVSLTTPVGPVIDLAKLTQAERDALPASAFVFPKTREYPIHDREHGINALSRSKGKPERAAVRAAVRRRYPDLPAFQKG